MPTPDPYSILGVAKSADASELKSAYRKLAKKLHPDVNPGRKDIEQKFKEVTAAYDLLSDADKRARYDRGEIDSQGQERGFSGGGAGYGGYGGGFRGAGSARASSAGSEDPFSAFGGMEDIFAEFMGGGARQRRGAGAGASGPARGSDVSYSINVSFIEAALGGKKRISLANDKTLDITIPAGVEDGHKLRLKGQGSEGAGVTGDALIELRIEPHGYFTRKDRDILVEVPISLPEAVLGASITVPTLDNQVTLKVPKGASSGMTLRLKGKGVAGSAPGDMLVKLKIALPEPLPQDLSDMMEKWAKKNAYNPRKKTGMN